MPPVILVTNDDGVHAAGLAALAAALEDLGDVYVVAPDREQSAVGHALTLHRPLRVTQMAERRFAVNGTPSDCVNLAVLGLLPERPVLVAAGINHGSNLGDNVPSGPASGIKMTRLGHRVYREKVVRETDPRGAPYYWIGAGPPEWNEDQGSDMAAVNRGLASVTPLHLDLTHYGALERMADWESGLNSLLKKRPR